MQSTHHDVIIRNAALYDGSGNAPRKQDVAICGQKISAVGVDSAHTAEIEVDASGKALAPGFIDVHTHDDIEVIRRPQMLNKISQGVTTVIVGNCGISASPLALPASIPDPIVLLGQPEEFRYPTFREYRQAVTDAAPAVNVAALIGHTSLRAQTMANLTRQATAAEAGKMQALLREAMTHGALGLSTGLAYGNANAATAWEVETIASELPSFNGLYATHLRTEFDGIIDALDEAFQLGRRHKLDVIISHLKCAGKANWGRSQEVLNHIEQARREQHIGCDCYPYSASSSTLDLGQVTSDFPIQITWSKGAPEMAGKLLSEVARQWNTDLLSAAQRLQPAGAVYHGMSEADVRQILSHPKVMIGSDGLPCDPSPHPRLWGSFPRVLSRYVRDEQLLPLALAIKKMTTLSAGEFGLSRRGAVKPGYWADLVLFDPATIQDKATFAQPEQLSDGIESVWVNGTLTYTNTPTGPQLTGRRAGQFIAHSKNEELKNDH